MSDVPAAKPQTGDAWESERPRRNVVAYFRDAPWRFFGALGAILFVGGWGIAIYFFLNFGSEASSGGTLDVPLEERLQYLVTIGASVTLAAGVLWGIAAYLWVQLLPDSPTDVDD